MKEILVIPATVDSQIFNNPNKLLRVASYSRVSTNSEEQILSFNTQKTYYTDLILKTKGWKLAGTYADEGISGVTEKKRPEFQKLLRHCKAGKIDLIITKSISRFSRNVVHAVERVRWLKSIGVGVYFEKENINTLEESSEFVLTILCSIAQEESHSLSLNVRKGIQMGMQNGNVTWNYTQSLGFRKGEDGNPEIIPEHAKVIKQIFTAYISGESCEKIAKTLNNQQALYESRKKKWTSAYIQRVLQNERFCGDVILQKTYIDNHISKKTKVNNGEFPKIHIKNNHPAIIPREEFDRATQERAKRTSKKSISKTSKTMLGKYSSKYALNGILVCDDCGSPYQRRVWTKRNKEKQPIWRCIKRLDYGTKYCETSATLDEESLHIAIMSAINKISVNTDNIIKFTNKEIEFTLYENKNCECNLDELQKQVENLTSQIADIIASGNVAENLEKIKEMNGKAVELNDLIVKSKEKLDVDNVSSIHEVPNIDKYDDKLVRQIIKTIKVISADEIVVCFKSGVEITQTIENQVKSRK